MMKFKALTILIFATLSSLALCQPVSYAVQTKEVNAGIVLLKANGCVNRAPHIWSNLDRNLGVKPAGWHISNPVGNGTLSASAAARWGVGNVGQRLEKDHAPYWEVVLETVAQETLNDFDVLALPAGTGGMILSPNEREKLRLFVDQGGILWIDFADGTNPMIAGTENSSLPLSFEVVPTGGGSAVNSFHPLLSYPNSISTFDLSRASAFVGLGTVSLTSGLFGSVEPILSGVIFDSIQWDTVAARGSARTLATGKVGEGYIVLSTEGIFRNLNLGWNGATLTTNLGYTSQGPVDAITFDAASKIAVNVLSLSEAFAAKASGSRSSNSIGGTVGAPAIRQYIAPGGYTTANQPAIFNGRVVTTLGDQVLVYDAKPGRNLDEDITGNPDDGIVEPVGQAADLIWSSANMGSALSAPTVAIVPNTTLGSSAQVWVHDANGNVHVFNLNGNAANMAPMATINPPADTRIPAPLTPVTIQDGMAFVTDVRGTDDLGRVWSIDARRALAMTNGANRFVVYGSNRMPEATSGPTVGYIPIEDNSGGTDRVAYVATAPRNNTAAGVSSVWIGARGESPTNISKIPNAIRISTRASLQRLPIFMPTTSTDAGGLTLSVIDVAGQPMDSAQLQTYFDGSVTQISPGILEFGLTPAGEAAGFDWAGTNPLLPDIGFRLDYNIDWSGPEAGTTPGDFYIRGNINIVDQAVPVRSIVGAPTLSAQGTIGISVRNNDNSGTTGSPSTFYLLEEQGRGDFIVRTRWEFHDEISTGIPVLGSGNVPYPASVLDEDAINNLIPFLNSQIRNVRLVGAPAAYGESMYVMAVGTKSVFGFQSPTAVLLAFNADPPVPQMELNMGVQQQRQQTNVIIKQPDMARSFSQVNPTSFSAVASNSFTVEPIEGSSRATVRLPSLATTQRGPLSSCLTSNLPIILQRSGQTETLIEPEAFVDGATGFRGFARGTFSPLKWYVVLNGYDGVGSPIVTGENVFLAGSSVLPSLITNGGNPLALVPHGLLYAMSSTISPNDSFLKANSLRPWQSQLWTMDGVSGPFNYNGVVTPDAIKWPQVKGIEGFEDFRIRVLQATLSANTISAMSAGEGTIAAATPTSLEVFSRSDIMVVDSGRISRFDSVGNPIWSAESTLYAGPNQPVANAAQVRKFSQPVRMYPTGNNGYVVVDAGNNIVSQIDSSGREVRSISTVKIHPNFRPDGASSNESNVLRKPQDVLFWTTFRTAAEVANFFPGEVLQAPATDERWDHWLIADAGNHRVIEVVDRYRLDANGNVLGVARYQDQQSDVDGYSTALGVMIWHTPEELSGKRYAYNTLTETEFPDGSGGVKSVIAFGFNNVEPGTGTFGLDGPLVTNQDNPMGYGGIVLYDGADTKVFTEFTVPGVNANTYITESPAGSDNYGFNSPTVATGPQNFKITGIRSVNLKYVDVGGTPTLAIMVAMTGGVYEIIETSPNVWTARWMLNTEAYVGMRRPRNAVNFVGADLDGNARGFQPMYARRLESNDVLIVNGYYGTMVGTVPIPFEGEVFLVDGSFNVPGAPMAEPGFNFLRPNLGFNSLSVMYELPPVQGIRGIINPVFAERK